MLPSDSVASKINLQVPLRKLGRRVLLLIVTLYFREAQMLIATSLIRFLSYNEVDTPRYAATGGLSELYS